MKDIRNMAFHYTDPNEKPATLIANYEAIDRETIDGLNNLLLGLVRFGQSLKQDALKHCG